MSLHGDDSQFQFLQALRHEQALSDGLRERVMELETENKTLKLQLQAKFAGEVDDIWNLTDVEAML